MAGSISLSLSQQFSNLGAPLSGGKLYFFQANTTTNQNAYKDTALTNAHPNPITLDSAGRVPEFYLADGNIHVRLTDSGGTVLVDAQNVLVVGPSSGGGGGGSAVDPTAIFQTGDMIFVPINATRSGWVRLNGRTIGSAVSGASERANADVSSLFTYAWTNFSNSLCAVSTGRGASAAADFAANKTLTLLDMRGFGPLGVDDMGNSDSGSLVNVPIVGGGSTVTAGTRMGNPYHTLTQAQLPAVSPTFSGTPISLGGSGGAFIADWSSTFSAGAGGTALPAGQVHPAITPAGTISALGSGSSHNNTHQVLLGSFYWKL